MLNFQLAQFTKSLSQTQTLDSKVLRKLLSLEDFLLLSHSLNKANQSLTSKL